MPIKVEAAVKVRLSKCSIGNEEVNATSKVLKSEYLGMGSVVLEFENAIQHYLETPMSVVCVNTATSALQLSIAALDIGYGDEVLVPSLTYVASFQAISATGATPVACEIDRDTFFLNVDDARNKITEKTKAIMPVHYASSSSNMRAVYDLAQEFNLRVVEDAAQAFGSKRDNMKIGMDGDIICFSFDGIKNITCGEGAAILTKDKRVLQRLQDDRLLGVQKDSDNRYVGKRSWDFDVVNQGFRFHMSNINAAIGLAQLQKVDDFKLKRQEIARRYIDSLSSLTQVSVLNLDYNQIMPHIFVIKVDRRDALREYLTNSGIECGLHYKPNHLLTKYHAKSALPETESCYSKTITLPCHVDLTIPEQNYVIRHIKDFFSA